MGKIYIKSVLAGLVTAVVCLVVFVVSVFWRIAKGPSAPVSIDLVAVTRLYSFWLTAGVTFFIGFYWKYHKRAR